MITALALCGYLASAHYATACTASRDPHAARFTVEATAQSGMLVFNPEEGALDIIAPALEAYGTVVIRGDWVGVAIVVRGEMPPEIPAWLDALDNAVQYRAAVAQDAAHLRDAKATGNIVALVVWGERLGSDRNQLGEAVNAWRLATGRALPPGMPERRVPE